MSRDDLATGVRAELVAFDCPLCAFPWLERSISESAGTVLGCPGCNSVLEPHDLLLASAA